MNPPPNPFAPTGFVPNETGIFGGARRLNSGFLYRVIDLGTEQRGEQMLLVYTGWWFLQRVYVQGKRRWWAVSWLTIHRNIEFSVARLTGTTLENQESPDQRVRIEIDFGRSLVIRRFRIWVDGQIRYDEIN